MRLVGKIKRAVRRMTRAVRRKNQVEERPFRLNAAQVLLMSFFEGHDGQRRDYKAPHAYRGTPPRPKRKRVTSGRLVQAAMGGRP